MPTAEPRVYRPMAHWQPAGTKLEYHPAAAQYPMMPEPELSRLVEDMKANGFDSRFPIALLDGKAADGRNRHAAAIRAGVEFLTTPLPKETDAEEYVKRANEHRRHLLPEWLHAKRQERIERVAAARVNGESLRTIAEREEVSVATVRRDLDGDGVPGGTPSPEGGIVTGRDGVQQPATKPSPVLCQRCSRCQRTGQPVPKNCEMCREMRGKTGKPRKNKPDTKATPVDPHGKEIPKRCRDAFADPWIQEAIDFIGVAMVEFRKERLADGMNKRAKHYPYFIPKDFIDAVGMVSDTLEKMLDHLKENRPAAVCPKCDGEGCSECRMSGLVPAKVYKELKGRK